jgi:hypothetical protein
MLEGIHHANQGLRNCLQESKENAILEKKVDNILPTASSNIYSYYDLDRCAEWAV